MKTLSHRSSEEARDRRRRRCMMTLAEVMVACMIGSMAMSGGVAVLKQGLWTCSYLRRRSTACDIAKNRLEHLRSLSYEDVPLMAEDTLPVNESGVPDPDGQFRRTTTVGAEVRGSREVTIHVTSAWNAERPELDVAVDTVVVDKHLFHYGLR